MENRANVGRQRLIVKLANANHKPFDTRIFQREAMSLVKAGYMVKIIIPSDRSVINNNVEIIPVTMPLKGWEQLLKSPWRLFRAALKQPSDAIFHLHDADILITGFLLKVLGRTVIYDAHENTPLQISFQHWIPNVIKKPYAWLYIFLEKMAGYFFDAIIVAEPVVAKYYPRNKTFLARNFPLAEAYNHEIKPFSYRENNLVYAGSLTRVRGLFEMLNASVIAKQNVDFNFVLCGSFSPPRLQQQVLNNYQIDFRDWLSYDELIALYSSSKIGIVVLHPIPKYKTSYPTKLFEYMVAGMAVICSREGEWVAFVEEANAGILVDPLDVSAIANAITWLLQHPDEAEAMGKRGRKLIMEKYNWENESAQLLLAYDSIHKH